MSSLCLGTVVRNISTRAQKQRLIPHKSLSVSGSFCWTRLPSEWPHYEITPLSLLAFFLWRQRVFMRTSTHA